MDRIASLKEFLKDSPKDSFLKHALALEYIKLGNDAAARQLFEELLGDDPGYVGSYYHLGRLLERSGDTEGAIRTFETGMEQAKKAGERHAYGELQAALDDLI
jgi:Tfp pilus assembly protein PilF